MEGRSRSKQSAPLVLRRYTPSRLQDDLLAATYDRLLAAQSSADRIQDRPRELELVRIRAEPEQAATTGG
jgi:hypothetical protein